jgi:hypothetical protein
MAMVYTRNTFTINIYTVGGKKIRTFFLFLTICSVRKRTWELLKEQQGAPKYVDTDMSAVDQELGENKRRNFSIKYRMPRTWPDMAVCLQN